MRCNPFRWSWYEQFLHQCDRIESYHRQLAHWNRHWVDRNNQGETRVQNNVAQPILRITRRNGYEQFSHDWQNEKDSFVSKLIIRYWLRNNVEQRFFRPTRRSGYEQYSHGFNRMRNKNGWLESSKISPNGDCIDWYHRPKFNKLDRISDSQQTRERRGIQHPKDTNEDSTGDCIDRPKYNALGETSDFQQKETRYQVSKAFDPRRQEISSFCDLTGKMV